MRELEALMLETSCRGLSLAQSFKHERQEKEKENEKNEKDG